MPHLEDEHMSKAHNIGVTRMPGRPLFDCTSSSYDQDSDTQDGARTETECARYFLPSESLLPSNPTPAPKAMLEQPRANPAELRS